ncbi:TRI39 ligase, partial [Chroicocephalus maculipennis]|nr:TRI39 ligase [Chroicocephalus maculipennis]
EIIQDDYTAHPRLEISDDGKSVKDTGTIRNVPRNEKRFDSHIFVLAKEGYTSGRHYWQVDPISEAQTAFGVVPEELYLVEGPHAGTGEHCKEEGRAEVTCFGLTTTPICQRSWTCLRVSGKLQKIGIFLDISAKKMTFYNIHKKATLYTFTISDGGSQEGKLFPFFSTGPAVAKPDTEPLKIVQGFDDE